MIISKTPVRISFFGGGTDYPDYFREFGGSVLSTTIDKYIYITVNKIAGLLDHKYRLAYSKLELCQNLNEIQHNVAREVLRYLQVKDGLEINIISDLPARTGLGSSSSCTVGLLQSIYAYQRILKTKDELAQEAIHIEYNILKERVGVQDQLAAAYGGLNYMIFDNDKLEVNPLVISQERKHTLEDNLLLFYTGISRFASEVLKEQLEKTQQKVINSELSDLYNMVQKGIKILTCEDRNLDDFGKLMHEGWMRKRSISNSISSPFLDNIYETALNAGALGGKLLGAGGGGFFLFYVPLDAQLRVKESLNHLQLIEFKFESGGSRIIHFD